MTELKREDLLLTKWDVRDWSAEQKILWQQECFKLSLTWGGSITVDHLTATHYFIGQLGLTYIDDNDHEYFLRKSSHKEKQFTDMFPDYEAPKPIDVVEEIKQLFVAEMGKGDSEGCSAEDEDEDERGFEGLVYVETGIMGASIPFKSLSEEQLAFIIETFNISVPTPCKTHVSFLTTGEVYFSSPRQSDKSCYNLTFNQLFKYEDEL